MRHRGPEHDDAAVLLLGEPVGRDREICVGEKARGADAHREQARRAPVLARLGPGTRTGVHRRHGSGRARPTPGAPTDSLTGRFGAYTCR